ncbi:uncharacterized protein LOC131236316 isoform X2 [Magnolia sinica]|uniref:uncharacterized protein LOC131236316 isoform X2 n=1 Tax=Magnolia sinica TaxID=86752 RepID=UPI00265ACA0A|nr:uncharacterized protein LOC131236316 isoform X2 [Magnolia sinica]
MILNKENQRYFLRHSTRTYRAYWSHCAVFCSFAYSTSLLDHEGPFFFHYAVFCLFKVDSGVLETGIFIFIGFGCFGVHFSKEVSTQESRWRFGQDDREYMIGRWIWESGRNYCVMKTAKGAKIFSAAVAATIDSQQTGKDGEEKLKMHTHSYCCLDHAQLKPVSVVIDFTDPSMVYDNVKQDSSCSKCLPFVGRIL